MIHISEAFRYLEKDLADDLRLFFGNSDGEYFFEILPGEEIEVAVSKSGGRAQTYRYPCPDYRSLNLLYRKRRIKRAATSAFYRFLQQETGKSFPYGAFTGIRPTKQYYTLRAEGIDPKPFFLDVLGVSPKKFELVSDIVDAQRDYYSPEGKNLDVYVGIPFCRGRCSYCSFVSCDVTKNAELEDPYVEALLREIEAGLNFASEFDWKYRALYIGGGTPSAIQKRNIERILRAVSGIKAPEFTFEAGRPDSIDRELLELLKAYGVTRVSVNPQSANDRTLERIGRRHTFADAVEKYALVKEYGFLVNCDLIMGLEGETAEDFERTVRAVIELKPDNVTVHSLALKKGSKLKADLYGTNCEKTDSCGDIGEMSEISSSRLKQAGYRPYYMYRQKYSAGNLENSGYALPGRECIYNIDNMEEIASVLAFGANAISKRVYPDEDRIERLASPKDIPSYVAKIEKISADKRIFAKDCRPERGLEENDEIL